MVRQKYTTWAVPKSKCAPKEGKGDCLVVDEGYHPLSIPENCKKLDVMLSKLVSKHPKMVNRCHPLLLHDNAKPHTALKLEELKLEVLPHPPYSPDLEFEQFLRGEKIRFPARCRKRVPRFRRVLFSKLFHQRLRTTSVEMAEVY